MTDKNCLIWLEREERRTLMNVIKRMDFVFVSRSNDILFSGNRKAKKKCNWFFFGSEILVYLIAKVSIKFRLMFQFIVKDIMTFDGSALDIYLLMRRIFLTAFSSEILIHVRQKNSDEARRRNYFDEWCNSSSFETGACFSVSLLSCVNHPECAPVDRKWMDRSQEVHRTDDDHTIERTAMDSFFRWSEIDLNKIKKTTETSDMHEDVDG